VWNMEPLRWRVAVGSAADWPSPRDRWRRPVVPAPLLARRCHGSLAPISDSERRALRPIGATAYEVAALTGVLLSELFVHPCVRIFQGVRLPTNGDEPCIPHVVNAGRRLVLIESVAWPPGRYNATATGRIHCDGTYIGQSAAPLMAAVRHWRRVLPRSHHVSALVVVHSSDAGSRPTLPATTPDLAWASAADVVRYVRTRLPHGRQKVSRKALVALVAATQEIG
jgi:hypothetical protein